MECGKLSCLAFPFPIYFCLFVSTAFSFPQLFSGVWVFYFFLSLFLSDLLEELLEKSAQFILAIIPEGQELIALIIT